jgi:3-isopropylmalate/(R)-2-methylmalate dehydratase small subunit
MEKFTTHTTQAVPLNIANVDTDQIIPARFLKATDKKGFGNNVFRDGDLISSGNPNSEFTLNNPTYSGSILIAGDNFGCGSSREHAAWALVRLWIQSDCIQFFCRHF